MQQAWRWFGSKDPVPLDYIRQAGAHHVVSSLHDVPIGQAWTVDAIKQQQAKVTANNAAGAPLHWTLVESIPVHDAIKTGHKSAQQYIDAYITSLKALASCGITTVCYNFMPLLDWTRTDLNWSLPSGGHTLRFDATAFAAFDLFILKRPSAKDDYSPERIQAAQKYLQQQTATQIDTLTKNILVGLPSGTAEAHTLAGFQRQLDRYDHIDSDILRGNLVTFLQQILPVAEAHGIKMAIHPDDPPRPLLGLPRIVSCSEDLRALFKAIPSPANGITLCTGSYGVRADNDLPAMAREFSERIFFAHLRGTRREQDAESFHEAEHLHSDVDMVGVVKELLQEESRRAQDPTSSHPQIPFRADHGHQILDDLEKSGTNPGYTAIGRLKGLAEIRGLMTGLGQQS